MKRRHALGSATVTGPASRSKTDSEYRVSRLGRTIGKSIDMGSRWCVNMPTCLPPLLAKFISVSARLKLSTVTGMALPAGACGVGCVCANARLLAARAASRRRFGREDFSWLRSPFSLSSDPLDVRQLPRLVEQRLVGT